VIDEPSRVKRPERALGGPRRVMSALAGSAVVAATVGLLIVAFVASRATGTKINDPLIGIAVALFGVVGGLLMVRRPGHRIPMVLSLVGIGGSLAALGAGLGSGDDIADAMTGNSFLDAGPLRLVGIAFGNAGWWMFVVASAGLLPLLFPTGEVPTRRWRPVLWALTAALGLMVVLSIGAPELCQFEASSGGGLSQKTCVANPIGIRGLPPAEAIVLMAFPLAVASVGGLVFRFRRSEGIERVQLKWLTFVLGVTLVIGVGEGVLESTGVMRTAGFGFLDPLGLAVLMIPVSIAVAVTRYRLFEIDRLISRTVSYAVLLLILGGVFGVVVAVPTLLLGGDDIPSWVVAVATLVVAGLFSPLRRRIRDSIDRRFDRVRYDAEVTIARLSLIMRDPADMTTIGEALLRSVADVFRPSLIDLWLRDAEP
jgi:hypothetical protein